MDDPFRSPKILLDHACRHINQLDACVSDFINNPDHAKVVDSDPETQKHIHKIKLAQRIPDDIGLIAFDALSALRAVLDQAVYCSAVAVSGGDPNTVFPMAEKAERFEALRKDRLKAVPQSVLDVVAALQPYQSGNKAIADLNKLRNRKIHRILQPIGIAVGGITLSHGIFVGSMPQVAPAYLPESNEIQCFTTFGTHSDYNLEVGISVCFSNISAPQGMGAPEVLRCMAREVGAALLDIERATLSEMVRLGIPPK